MKLFGYWRSSAAYRVRIALHLKQIQYQAISVHLVKNGGEQHSESYRQLNPSELVPTLCDGDVTLNQSLAIIDYLDEKHPEPALYPNNLIDKSKVKALALDIACDIHPLNNLRVLNYLTNEFDASAESKNQWYRHWIQQGFSALEAKLTQSAGKFCFGDQITVADLCLIPQIYNAKRFNVDLTPFPTIVHIDNSCQQVDAFKLSLPEMQEDAS